MVAKFKSAALQLFTCCLQVVAADTICLYQHAHAPTRIKEDIVAPFLSENKVGCVKGKQSSLGILWKYDIWGCSSIQAYNLCAISIIYPDVTGECWPEKLGEVKIKDNANSLNIKIQLEGHTYTLDMKNKQALSPSQLLCSAELLHSCSKCIVVINCIVMSYSCYTVLENQGHYTPTGS